MTLTTRHLMRLGALTLSILAGAAQAAGGPTGLDTRGDVRSERAACLDGRSPQDRTTCLRETHAAAAEKRAGRLEGGTNFAANARARCDMLSGDDKSACEARMAGQGQVSGSVAGGGLLRALETVVAPPAATSGGGHE